MAREAQARGVKALADRGRRRPRRTRSKRWRPGRCPSSAGSTFSINNAAIRPHKPFTELTPQDWEAVRGRRPRRRALPHAGGHRVDGEEPLRADRVLHRRRGVHGRVRARPRLGGQDGSGGAGARSRLGVRPAEHPGQRGVARAASTPRARNPEWYQGRTPNAAGIPLGRQGTVDEIAATCLFLVTDDGGFITGQTIHASGGVAYY